ncbi:MAG: hypothetical protein Q8O42_17285 [Acidobacteriota bacterium]|nr:hypothetical protein [Acidobacteriota bacterium]
MSKILVTLGDSVHWGQGLVRAHKLHWLVFSELFKTHPGLQDHLFAHSGATIGIGATVTRQRVDGEVPIAYPTILEQVQGFVANPGDVLAVLVNGGINDVDIRNILNPTVSPKTLAALIEEYCYDSMRVLLETICRRFDNPGTRIVLTPYYPILSPLSKPFGIPWLLANEGLALPPNIDLASGTNILVAKCMQFWKESHKHLRQAANEVNAGLSQPRVTFADPGFTENNAVFAGEPWLFGLKNDPFFSPQDEVVNERRAACNLAFPPHEFPSREQCYRASAGHPNVEGARRYAAAISAAIGV